jgi:hypothetical protein
MRALYNMTWPYWWLYTVRRGVVWANCPTWASVDGLDPAALITLEVEGRRRIFAALDYARTHLPGFRDAYVADTAPMVGIRQTRLLSGAYRLTPRDIGRDVASPTSSAARATTRFRTARSIRTNRPTCWWPGGATPPRPRPSV